MIYLFSNNEFKKAVLTKNRFGLTCVSLGSFWVKTRDTHKLGKGSTAMKNEKGAIVIAPKLDGIVIIYKGDGEISHDGWSFFNVEKNDIFTFNGKKYYVDNNLNIAEYTK